MPDPFIVFPSEMVLNVFDHLPSLRVWQLRKVSRLWNATLSDARFETAATKDFQHVDPSDIKARVALLKTHHRGRPAGVLHRRVNRFAFTVHDHQVRYPALVGHFTAYSLSNGIVKIHNLETGGEWTKDANTPWAPKLSLTDRLVAFIGQEYPDGPQVLFWSKLHDLDQPMQQWRPTTTLEGLARNGYRIALITDSHEIKIKRHDEEDEDYISFLLKRPERATEAIILIYNTLSSLDIPEYSFRCNHPISYIETMIIMEPRFITVMTISRAGLDSHTLVFGVGTHVRRAKRQLASSQIVDRRAPDLIAPHIHKIGDDMHYHIMFFDQNGYIEDVIIKAGPSGAQFADGGLPGPRGAFWRNRYYQLEGGQDNVAAESAVELYVKKHKLGARLALGESLGMMMTARSFGLNMRFCLANDWYLVALGPARHTVRDEVQVLTFLETGLQVGPAVSFDPIRDLGRGHWVISSLVRSMPALS